MFNEGTWNAQRKTCESNDIPHTMEGNEVHYTAFVLGAPYLQAAGCSMQPSLKLPCAWVVLCISHLIAAIGCLSGVFVAGRIGGSPFRSVKTGKFSLRRGVRVGVFTSQPPSMGRKRPIFFYACGYC